MTKTHPRERLGESLAEVDPVRRHIEHKRGMRELTPEVAGRMLTALDGGSPADYALLLEAATFLPLPVRCYHSAPMTARASISAQGLRVADPEAGPHGRYAAGQGVGVYVSPAPDVAGKWSHHAAWDMWEIDTRGLGEQTWSHDRLNPGCWILLDKVPVPRLRLWGSSNS